jgi:hypothetical protein
MVPVVMGRRLFATCMVVGMAACAELKAAAPDDGDAGRDPALLPPAAPPGAPGAVDAAFSGSGPTDAGASDASTPAVRGADGGTDAGATGLDPGVALPDLGGESCSPPGFVTCGGVRACRLATPDSGRCEDCGPRDLCRNLIGTPCSKTLDCDVNLQCFRGRCTLACSLPLGNECGGVAGWCLNVGSPLWGLCDPATL